ncbi:MAG: M48 family metallopeptidase [Proteobacteria bacterium]|nr:M48 family metallopeptidase [Pseudomonadota bacterium]
MTIFFKTILLFFLLSAKLVASPALSDESLIRDAEIEYVLKSYTKPIFEVAQLNPNSLHLYVINSNVVNAFAMGGGRIAINTGLLLKAKSALQVIGVLAHETAHIADNHVIRGTDAIEKALLQSLIGTLGGIAVSVAGRPDAGMGIMMGSQEMAMRGYLKFSRTQEGSADQGAAKYLDALKWSSLGCLQFMELLRKDDFISEQQLDPYVLTHPLISERLDFFRAHLSTSPHAQATLPDPFEENFKRIQVKLIAFTQSPVKIFARFKPTDTSLLARYGRSIAYFQNAQVDEALKELDSLLKEFPQDAFFWDLKGQILFESGKIKDAILAYEKAVELRPDIPLLHVNFAHSLIEGGNNAHLEKAYSALLRARTEEPDNPFIYRLLAIYYGKKEKTGLAALCLSEMAFEIGDLDKAEQQAKRALHFLKEDAPNKARANDILEEVKRLRKRESWLD